MLGHRHLHLARGDEVTICRGQCSAYSTTATVPALVSQCTLGVSMPDMDGLEVCRQIRKTSGLPILFLSARDEEIDRVLGLEIGGDDYVTKPFSPRELVARVKAILKRSGNEAEPERRRAIFVAGELSLDRLGRTVM